MKTSTLTNRMNPANMANLVIKLAVASAMTVFGLSLASCSGSVARTQYLLRAEAPDRALRVDAPARVGLGRVEVAPYLDQSGIVVEIEPGRVQVASEHQWAEPLDAGLRTYLRAELSAALGYEVGARVTDPARWDYTVDVMVETLHGTMAGTAVIDDAYRVAPRTGAAKAVEYRFSRTAALPRAGYPGLVDAEAALVHELAASIADTVGRLSGQ